MSEFGMEYEIVHCGKTESTNVIMYLKLGWKLYGSPFVDKEGLIRQAMTRGVDEDNSRIAESLEKLSKMSFYKPD